MYHLSKVLGITIVMMFFVANSAVFAQLTISDGKIEIASPIFTSGDRAGFYFAQRDNAQKEWAWYALQDVAHLHHFTKGNILSIDLDGNVCGGGKITSTGVTAGFYFAQRDNAQKEWAWYALQDVAHLHHFTEGNILSIDLNGNLRVKGTILDKHNMSDMRLKKSIVTVPDALTKVLKLRGVSFEWKDEAVPAKYYGVIAQEVEKVVPEVVSTDREGYKYVAYSQLSAVLIEAVKEQNGTIEKHKNQLKTQQEQIDSLNTEVEALKKEMAELRKLIQPSK